MLNAANQSSPCDSLDDVGSFNTGSTPTVTISAGSFYPVNFYYDASCTQPYITDDVTSVTGVGPNTAVFGETATYFGLSGATLGTLTLNVTLSETTEGGNTTMQAYGLGSFAPAGGHPTVQLGLSCAMGSSSSSATPCTGAIAQDVPALNMAIGAATSLNLTAGSSGGASFTGDSSIFTGSLGGLTLTNPTPSTFVVQGGTAFGSATASGSAAALAMFPPTPTGWSLADTAHDQNLQITVIDNTTRNSSLTITQISTGKTLATGLVDHSGTGSITYSDGSVAAITSWTVGD
jgi:hypothetical protein